MKRPRFILFFILSCFIPLSVYSIQFLKIDEKGNHYFACERASGHTISVKEIDKNKFKVIGDTIGKIVYAESESKAAVIVCGEGGSTNNNTTE